jgi:hypothetical protein
MIKPKRNSMLGKLFITADELGIDREEVRNVIAPGLLHGKRLSAASEQEIAQVLTHLSAPSAAPREKKYASSLDGLKAEICDLARERFGDGPPSDIWEEPLNNLCIRFGVKRWQWLDVAHGKEIKAALIRLQLKIQHATPNTGSEEVPF